MIPLTIVLSLSDETEKTYSAKYEVCPCCEGKGKVLNPSIAHHAYTPEDMDEDPEFFEEYQKGESGIYGVVCGKCAGTRVVLVPDWAQIPAEVKKEYLRIQRELAECDRIQRWEIENGA